MLHIMTPRDLIQFVTRHGAEDLRVTVPRAGERAVIRLFADAPPSAPVPMKVATDGLYEVYDFTPSDDPDGPRVEVRVPRRRG